MLPLLLLCPNKYFSLNLHGSPHLYRTQMPILDLGKVDFEVFYSYGTFQSASVLQSTCNVSSYKNHLAALSAKASTGLANPPAA